MEPGDVYIYAHANGAILDLGIDGRSRLVPLAEAQAIVEGCHQAGHQVFAAQEDTPVARAAMATLEATGVPLVGFAGAERPHHWSDGTNALIEAAAFGNDRILDDLIGRDVEIDRVDDSGSTALHHAAANGSLHAIDALLSAGARVDPTNAMGLTPFMLAKATHHPDAARQLGALGGATSGSSRAVGFGRSHDPSLFFWALLPLITLASAVPFLWPLSLVDALVLMGMLAGWAVLSPPLAFWAGGAPRRLDGTILTLRSLTLSRRQIDLTGATGAAVGGMGNRRGNRRPQWLIIGHPDGHRVSARTLGRLMIPAEAIENLEGQMDRVVVVPLAAAKGHEVVLEIGNVLTGLGVEMSGDMRAELVLARKRAGQLPSG